MSFDLKRTFNSQRLGRPIAAGTVISQEGVILCSVLQNGVEAAAIVPTVVGTEVVLGFSVTADSLPSQTSNVESVTVPASGTFEVSLAYNNIVTGSVFALVVATNTPIPTVTYCPPGVYAGAAGAGEVKVNLAAGTLKFNSAYAGQQILVTYMFQLTLTQAQQLFGQRFINNNGLHAIYGQLEVGAGLGELWTDQFDSSANWSTATPFLGNNGQVVAAGPGPALNAVVVHVPEVVNPYLGLRFRFAP